LTLTEENFMQGLYLDPETGKIIITNSMMKTFRRCPMQAEFKYVDRLKPKLLGAPLKRGTWVHALIEEYHNGGDWRALHQKFSTQFAQMFDEEKEFYGDMPTEILLIMESYMWHYANDPWIIHETEFTIETEFPDGTIFRGKVDALAENQFGLWLVDHKTHKSLPNHDYRLLDTQSALYIWAALRSKIPVQGFIWNYIKWKAPTVPALLKDKTRISKSSVETDYPTYTKALKQYKAENPGVFKITPEYVERQKYLKSQRYVFGEPQTSPFFRRDVMEKKPDMLKRVALAQYRTSQNMHSYDFSNPDSVERNVERSCEFSCSYRDVCTAELIGGNIRPLIRQNYTIGDPNDYYQDRAGDLPEKE